MEEMSSYHSIPTSCQIFVQASNIATHFLHCLTLRISPFIFLKPKYDLMRNQQYKLHMYTPGKARDGQNYYVIIINKYLMTEMCTRSHQTQPKLPLKRVTVSVVPTHCTSC